MTNPIDQMTKDELAEAFDQPMTPKQAADCAVAYANMKRARFLLPDGEIMDPKDYSDSLDALSATLKKHIDQFGPIHIEGVGEFKLQPRSLPKTWDVKALEANDPETFARLLDLGCLTVNAKVADQQEKAGNVTMFQHYGHAGSTTALVWDRGAK